MARGRRKVVVKDYENLIEKEKEFISQLESKEAQVREDIKFHKANLKSLKKILKLIRFKKLKKKK